MVRGNASVSRRVASRDQRQQEKHRQRVMSVGSGIGWRYFAKKGKTFLKQWLGGTGSKRWHAGRLRWLWFPGGWQWQSAK